MEKLEDTEPDDKQKLIIVSNRLPVSVKKENGEITFTPSSGGLATAMSSLDKKNKEMVWIGWPGLPSDDLTPQEKSTIKNKLKEYDCYPVFLTSEQVDNFYFGYANDTIWPLFHYFPVFTRHHSDFWKTYETVNQIFKKSVIKQADDNSLIWIHDYHLMLLPAMLRESLPGSAIGFFLHIPFPSYEIFRTLPNRIEILNGLLGADLVGFHIYDYVRHFFTSTLRLLGKESKRGIIGLEKRNVKADSFPIGIDYKKFSQTAKKSPRSEFGKTIKNEYSGQKVILSVDRLDYTKGILKRLEAFEQFLKDNPGYHKKVKLVVVAVPSRIEVETYKDLRNEIELAIGRINGAFGLVSWTPISYHFRNLPFEEVVALYERSDIALVTPLRDGMNLVAKEYVASKINKPGVLILSEMAGAADELQESIYINPNDIDSMVYAIKLALKMPIAEQKRRIKNMQDRISQYTVQRWGNDFLEQLIATKDRQNVEKQKFINRSQITEIIDDYRDSLKRAIFLDYDGTLREFSKDFSSSKSGPPKQLMQLLTKLTSEKSNKVYIISGRPHDVLEKWFGKLDINLVAEHGAWIKHKNKWQQQHSPLNGFKKDLQPIFDRYTERTPGAKTEIKTSAIVWHYRSVSPELAYTRRASLRRTLEMIIDKDELAVHSGNKIIEVKAKKINKGRIVHDALKGKYYDFILAIGDDYTDEDMFRNLPKEAHTIKVGYDETSAKYQIDSVKDVVSLLAKLSETG